MKLEIDIHNTENLGEITTQKLDKFREIFSALITSGALTGVKAGQAVIHFDGEGNFMGVQLSYWPWKRRK